MLFNSFEFLVFLPIVFLLYWFVFRTRDRQNALIVAASYLFYGWWDWRFLLLIALTTVCSFGSGLLIDRMRGGESHKAQLAVCVANIVLNLAILGIFKYYNFFVENLQSLFGVFGLRLDWATIHVVLPVGISFYTFQALGYTIDVYRNDIKATRDFVAFTAFISFFPQLVAGPIERATQLLPQFQNDREFDYAKAVDGCRQMLWGFFKKMVIADNCAGAVNQIWANQNDETGLILLIGGILFTFQIYCDFSGYSDIAIGCARLFGFNLMRNFNYPYFSRSIPEFWRRWHISLTTWFRDYIYFPLGGSRCAKWKIIRNIFIVWGISGLWHGANWNFVCWGLFHASLLAIYNLLGIRTKFKQTVAHGRWLPNGREWGQMLLTFFLAVIGWIIFRSESMSEAANYLHSMFDRSLLDIHGSLARLKGLQLTIIFPSVCLLLLFEWIQREQQHALQLDHMPLFRHGVIRYAFYIVFVMGILGFAGSQSEFIYFQF